MCHYGYGFHESGRHRLASVSKDAKCVLMHHIYQIIHELIPFINSMIPPEWISLG